MLGNQIDIILDGLKEPFCRKFDAKLPDFLKKIEQVYGTLVVKNYDSFLLPG